MNRYALFFTAVGLTAVATDAHAAGPYQISAVPTLPDGTRNFALDINNNRQVSGNSGMTGNTTLNPYLATGGWVTYLGTINTTNVFGRGYAVNDDGVVVGESDNNNSNAFVYRNGAISGLTRLAGDNTRGVAHDINNSSVIVGISSNGTASRATRWADKGSGYAPADLGSIDGLTTTPARAWAINNNGVAVGLSRNSGGTSQATIWDNGTTTNLGSLGDGTRFSQAYGINGNNVAVGSSSTGQTVGQLIGTTSTTGITRAFEWESGVIAELTPFNLYTPTNDGATTNYHSVALDVNDAGLIVGNSQRIAGLPAVATLWEAGVAIDLNTFLPANTGWVLQSAEGINALGDITGFGTFGGNTRAFVLTVPEPASALLLAGVGGVAMLRRRRIA